ncbi:unnamed protein product [Cuscuta europaea]|uniref:Uncharacterized protein n=1 Tax=Cuscuta europaea TaxID=41803 RepID=A0A9P0ZAD4_CUSEU|nr:unnamed protein product [Cuscuta europaea]
MPVIQIRGVGVTVGQIFSGRGRIFSAGGRRGHIWSDVRWWFMARCAMSVTPRSDKTYGGGSQMCSVGCQRSTTMFGCLKFCQASRGTKMGRSELVKDDHNGFTMRRGGTPILLEHKALVKGSGEEYRRAKMEGRKIRGRGRGRKKRRRRNNATPPIITAHTDDDSHAAAAAAIHSSSSLAFTDDYHLPRAHPPKNN